MGVLPSSKRHWRLQTTMRFCMPNWTLFIDLTAIQTHTATTYTIACLQLISRMRYTGRVVTLAVYVAFVGLYSSLTAGKSIQSEYSVHVCSLDNADIGLDNTVIIIA